MLPENTESPVASESKPKRGRPALPPGEALSVAVVANLRPSEADAFKAKAKAMGKPRGTLLREFVLGLIASGAILVAGCSGGAVGFASTIGAAKPVLDVTCHVVDMIQDACEYMGAGGSNDASPDAGSPDAGAPDAGGDSGS